MSKLLKGLPAQLLLVTVLPLTLIVTAVSFGAVAAHQNSMRSLVAERDMRAIQATANMLNEMLNQCVERMTLGGNDAVLDSNRARECLASVDFDTLINPTADHRRVTAFVVDAQGRAILHTESDRIGADELVHGGVAEALRGEHGTLYEYDARTGEEHVVSYAPLAPADMSKLGIIIEEPWQQVIDPVMQYSMVLPLVMLPVTLLAAIGFVLGMRRIVRPLQQMEARAQVAREGDLSALALPPPEDAIEEIQELQVTLASLAQRVQSDQARLRTYAQAVTSAQEDERQRLARELHDDTIQSLIALQQRVQTMRRANATEPGQHAAVFDELQRSILRTIDDVRRFSRALRPLYLEEAGLIAALERLTREAQMAAKQQASPIHIVFRGDDSVPRLEANTELTLYRIAQEALNNAMRHSTPSTITVDISLKSDESLKLSVCDDGIGFDVVSPKHGFGLVNMRERASQIGASLHVSSHPVGGSTVTVEYPMSGGRSHLSADDVAESRN